jgi:aerobic-type carbon monoxide dehydrogenase small subunit (CoxS/CutS family)
MTAKATLDANPNATDSEIHEVMDGILCRCFAHNRMMKAIRKYAEANKHA